MAGKGRQQRSGKSPRDATGRKAEQLQQDHADEVAARQRELGMLSAVQVAPDSGVVTDYTGDDAAAQAELENQQLATVRETVVGEPYPDAAANAQLRGTTLQPGQTGVRPTDTGGGTSGQANVSAGAINSAGYMQVGNESVKTNATAPTGVTGYETPGHVPGAVDGSEAVRGRVDTVGDTINQTPNWGIKGLEEDPNAVVDLGEVRQEPVRVVDAKPVVIMVNTPIEQMTFGNDGKTYDFVPGHRYRVPAALAAHLEEKGYIWH